MVLNLIACFAVYQPPNAASTLASAHRKRAIDLDVTKRVRLFKYSSYRETIVCMQVLREAIVLVRNDPVVAGMFEPLPKMGLSSKGRY